MYKTQPTLFGDAQQQPFANNTFDPISFLEVLEHLPSPHAAIKESYRVLKPGGKLILSMPFLYPIHDAPYDFQRLTIHGLRQLVSQYKFRIIKEEYSGNPLTSAMLLSNIAMVKTVLNALVKKHPAALLVLVLPLLVPILNVIGWLAAVFGPDDDFMPHGYTLHLTKDLS